MSQATAVEKLLDSFTTVQLKELDLSLAPSGGSAIKPGNHKEYAQQILKSYEGKRVAAHALRLETVLPFKHVFLFTFTVPGGKYDLQRLWERVNKGFPGLFESPKVLEPKEELAAEVCVLDKARKRLLVKFVHLVETWAWAWTSTHAKEMKPHKRRHPVVVSIFPEEQLLTVSFPGFTQGAFPSGEERTTYSDIARNACSEIKEQTDIRTEPFPLRPAIDLLLQKEPSVIAVRRYSREADGRIMLDSREGHGSSEAFLAQKLSEEANIKITPEDIRAVFNSMEAADILLHWTKKEIFTRVSFNEDAPEILFIWKMTAADAALIDEILGLVMEYRKYATTDDLSKAINFVDEVEPGTIIRPVQVGQQLGISLDETLKILYRAMDRKIVDILFRVKTDDALVNFTNDWRSNLSEFPKQVTDEHGNNINLSEFKNIEVAFLRLSA